MCIVSPWLLFVYMDAMRMGRREECGLFIYLFIEEYHAACGPCGTISPRMEECGESEEEVRGMVECLEEEV